GAVEITHRNFDHLEVELGGTEHQIEIAEGVELAEIAAVLRQLLVILAPQRLGAAERVGEALVQQEGEDGGDEAVADQIEEAHCTRFHRIDEAGSAAELYLARRQRLTELRQALRRNGEVGVEDDENIPARLGEALAHGVALALAVLPEHLDVEVGMRRLHPEAFLVGAVAAMALDID